MKTWKTRQFLGPLLVLAGTVVLATPPSWAGDEPQRGGPGRTEENAPQVEARLADEHKRSGGGAALVLREAPLADGQDRGSFYTDAGEGRTGVQPNRAEQEKLASARAAVAAARDAGTLHAGPPEVPNVSAAEIERRKREHLAALQPQVLPGADGSGAGEVPPPVQQVGLPGLNAHEQAKVAGDLRGAPAKAEAVPAEPEPTREQADGGQQKEGR
ncbi:MAG: hypothetical protein R6X25_08550 [Candidatus Krumholzibacteriia bacterium]